MPFLMKIILALSPVPLYYLIYFRHFHRSPLYREARPQYLMHAESFISGMVTALVIMVIDSLVNLPIMPNSPLFQSFVLASMIEKASLFICLSILFRFYDAFSIMEAIIAAVLVALGFATVENIYYSLVYGSGIIVVRSLFSVPLHITTMGLMGYFLGEARYLSAPFSRLVLRLMAFVFPVLIHGSFDYLLMGRQSPLPPLLLILFLSIVWLEFLIARAYRVPGLESLMNQSLRYEEWLAIDRQPRYQKWIYLSMGRPDTEKYPLFKWHHGMIPTVIIAATLGLTLVGYRLQDDILALMNLNLSQREASLFLMHFPLSLSIATVIIGILNPEFFKHSLIRIPLIFNAVLSPHKIDEETYVTYEISTENSFIQTAEPLGIGTATDLYYESHEFSSPIVYARVVWENHDDPTLPIGSIIAHVDVGRRLNTFILKYSAMRFLRGFLFTLKLPGFERVRRFFVKPSSIMQTDMPLPKGTVLFNEGELGTDFYLVKKGRITLYHEYENDVRVKICDMERGDIFGELGITGDPIRSATAIAEVDTIVSVTDIDNLKILILNNPDFAYKMVMTLAKHLKMNRLLMQQLYQDAREKACKD